MHALDPILLFAIANVVAWPATLYLDDDNHIRIIGNLLSAAVGAFVMGLTAQWFFPETFKVSLIVGAFAGAITLLYLVRYRKWR